MKDNRKEKKAITIYDIAKEAGVSTATVSRVLSGSASVSKERRERILTLVDQYRFRPSALARGLSDARSKTIGILTADVRNPFYAEMFVACEEAADALGYTVLLANTLGRPEQEIRQLTKFCEQRTDAVIQIGGSPDKLRTDPDYATQVSQILQNVPIVVTGKLDGANCLRVCLDEVRCTRLLMEHLFSLGHREIAFLCGRDEVYSTFQKHECYRQMLEQRGIPYREELVLEGRCNFQGGYDQMNKLLDSGLRPTAVIGINDYAALGIRQSAVDHGLRIPEDISLVGFDNTELCQLVDPPLTSVDYQYPLFGRILVETAVAAIEGREMPEIQWIRPRLAARASSGPARK